jgi:heme/copper-type cytochrome/quinol oxidase subunit 3
MTEMIQENAQAHGHDDHIHMPPPSYWPLVLGLSLVVLAVGMAMRGGRFSLSPPLSAEQLQAFNQAMAASGPWVAAGGVALLVVAIGGWAISNVRERAHSPAGFAGDSKMAMWVFLGNEVLFFTGLIASFLLLRYHSPDPQVDKALIDSIPLVSLNTFILLASSLTVVLAHDAATKGKQSRLILFLILTIVLGSTFVTLQGVEYRTLYAERLTWISSGYGTAFFTLTGTHGLHVIVGIIWCVIILVRALQGGFTKEHYGGVEIFGLYWHFVDVVWILLFTLVYLMHRATPEQVEATGRLLLSGFGLW